MAPIAHFIAEMIRVLIADDHDAVRQGVRSLLLTHREVQVCGEADNGAQARAKAIELKPDVILLDIAMPIMNGFQVATALRDKLPETPIIFFSVYDTPQMIKEAKRVGVRGFVSKSAVTKTLLKAVEALVVRRATFFPN